MKRSILFVVLFLIGISLKAQDCTPSINTSLTTLGLTPSQLPDAVTGVPYNEVIDWVIPNKVDNYLTPPPGDSISLCAIGVGSYINLPAGFTLEVWSYDNIGTPLDILAQTTDTIHIVQGIGQLTRACIRIKSPNPIAPFDMTDCIATVDSPDVKLIYWIWTDLFGCSPIDPDTLDIGLTLVDTPGSWTHCDTLVANDPGSLCTSQSLFICPGDTVQIGSNIYTASGTYYDFFTATSGCDSMLTTHLSVIDCSGIDDESSSSLLAYPNPTTGWIYIEASINQYTEVMDTWGRVVYKGVSLNGNINLENFTQGLYYIRVGNNIVKVLKQ